MKALSSLPAVISAGLVLLGASPSLFAQPLNRVAASTLQLPTSLSSSSYTTQVAFPGVTFIDPLAVVTAPGDTNRVYVVEKAGRIIVVDLNTPSRKVFLDLTAKVGSASGERGLLSLAFHPNYATNRQFFVWYTLNTTTPAGTGLHDRLSRFTRSTNDATLADSNSETAFITQFDEEGNHNGGTILFGNDGYLYLSLGDEGAYFDLYQNSQRINKDFFSGVIRIDVDRKPANLAPNPHPAIGAGTYFVPADNPFVGATSFNGSPVTPSTVRTELWAVGLRNPFRMSIDSVTGQIWLADVGQGQREEINLIEKGKNYGWDYREGLVAANGNPGTPPPAASFTNPIWDYGRDEGFVVTGGLVYRGSALPGLVGAYLFSDYGSGRLWALRDNGDRPLPASQVTELLIETGIAGFGTDPRNGDVLLADLDSDTIRRLVGSGGATALPATLTATGAFSNVANLTPAAGVVEYAPNVTFWSDYAQKRRWFALPDTTSRYTYAATENWTHPTGAVWVKHFDLETTRGNPATARRIETRFLVKTADGVYGLSYRWNDAQTEANLVGPDGDERTLNVTEDGVIRPQTWQFPSRAACLTCHTPQGGYALSFNTRQLNRNFPGGSSNQVSQLASAGYLTGTPGAPSTLPKMAAATDTSATLEVRVRSFLDANCVFCHQPGGSAQGNWDARFSTATASAGIVNGTLVNTLGDSTNRVIVPGNVEKSILVRRVASNSSIRMPPVGSKELDPHGIALLEDYVAQLGSGTRTGLVGQYYNNITLAGTPILRRTDRTVNFGWGNNAPGPGVNTDNFSVRWQGRVIALHAAGTQTYTFYTTTDDGVRLWVNGQKIIDSWVPQSGTERTGTIALTAGQDYPIVMEYFDSGYNATARLSWSTAGIAKQIVPTLALIPPEVGEVFSSAPVAEVPTRTLEAESLTRVTSGPTTNLENDAAASGGQWIKLNATAAGQSISFTIPQLAPGTYTVKLRGKRLNNRGRASVALAGGTGTLSNIDQYAATASYPETTLGTWTNPALADRVITFTVTGRTSPSVGFTLSIDRLVFEPVP